MGGSPGPFNCCCLASKAASSQAAPPFQPPQPKRHGGAGRLPWVTFRLIMVGLTIGEGLGALFRWLSASKRPSILWDVQTRPLACDVALALLRDGRGGTFDRSMHTPEATDQTIASCCPLINASTTTCTQTDRLSTTSMDFNQSSQPSWLPPAAASAPAWWRACPFSSRPSCCPTRASCGRRCPRRAAASWQRRSTVRTVFL